MNDDGVCIIEPSSPAIGLRAQNVDGVTANVDVHSASFAGSIVQKYAMRNKQGPSRKGTQAEPEGENKRRDLIVAEKFGT